MKFEIGVRVGSKWYYTKAEDSYAAMGCMREIGAELMVPEIDMDELVKSMARMLQGELVRSIQSVDLHPGHDHHERGRVRRGPAAAAVPCRGPHLLQRGNPCPAVCSQEPYRWWPATGFGHRAAPHGGTVGLRRNRQPPGNCLRG